MPINEDTLCILRRGSYTDFLLIDFFALIDIEDNDLDYTLSLRRAIWELKGLPNDAMVRRLSSDRLLTPLLSGFDYCEDISRAYQGLGPLDLQANSNTPISSEMIYLRLHAFLLERAYRKCERNYSIVAFSHRKCGWNYPKFDVSPDFSFHLYTNFGYGQKSYFYTKISYKGLDIVPFSEWIHYQYADLNEIVRYSMRHELEHNSWLEAMQYICDAYNLSVSNPSEFVSQFIIAECERMVAGLEYILQGDKFIFFMSRRIHQEVHKTGHDLIEFRGEKISGALSFIATIVQLRTISDVESFVKRIENCNNQLRPILLKERLSRLSWRFPRRLGWSVI